MFKITNEELIQIAAIDAGLDPFAEYCTKGVYEAAGYKVRRGEKPVLVLELWCPRQSKEQAETLSTSEPQQANEASGASVGNLFFQFKTCHLFTREQVRDAEELEAEKLSKKFAQDRKKSFRQLVRQMGGIAPSQDYSIPQWAKKSGGLAIDVAVDEISQQGWPVQDANGLYDLLLAM